MGGRPVLHAASSGAAISARGAPKRRTRASRGDLKEKILSSALALFKEKGYAASSVEEIAARAGAAKGSVYWHFAGKEDLLLALVDGEIDRLRARLAGSGPTSRGEAALIAAAMDLGIWRSEGLDDLRRVVLSAVEASGDSPERSSLCSALFKRGLALYEEVARRLAQAFREVGPPAGLSGESAAECLLACVWGAVHMLATRGWPRREQARLAEAMRALFLPGRSR